MDNHTPTPLPWEVKAVAHPGANTTKTYWQFVVEEFPGGKHGEDKAEAEANAAFIARAVNNFEKERAERYRLLHQLKKVTHQLKMRRERTEAENNAIATAEKAIAKAEGANG